MGSGLVSGASSQCRRPTRPAPPVPCRRSRDAGVDGPDHPDRRGRGRIPVGRTTPVRSRTHGRIGWTGRERARSVVHPDVDAYISRSVQWSDAMAALRPILLGCELAEELKWRKPCYGHDGRNIAIMQEMKDFLALMFFKGALLDDPAGLGPVAARWEGLQPHLTPPVRALLVGALAEVEPAPLFS